jgi:NADH:ubiquinone oxidoreductase subunit 5 (subunit L)/multisubunit Na+/H+ antiporter MnhA subunit
LCGHFDRVVIDGAVNGAAMFTTALSRVEGMFDTGVVDGLVNLFGRVVYSIGTWSRTLETGRLRNYLMLLVVGLVVLSIGVLQWISG